MSWKPSTPAVTADEIERVVSEWPVVVVHVWAEWNQVDRVMDAEIQSVLRSFSDVGFFALEFDLDENMSFVIEHTAYQIPVMLCFLWGQYHSQFGFYRKAELQERIVALIEIAES